MLTITTRGIPRSEQQEFWRATLTDLYFALDSLPPAPAQAGYDSRMTRLEFGGLIVDRVRADPNRVDRTTRLTRASPSDTVQISLLRRGRAAISQSGRVALLAHPGDFVLIDTGREYSSEFITSGEQVMIQVPRDLVVSALGPVSEVTARTVKGRCGPAALAASALLALIRQPSDRDDAIARTAARAAVELAAGAVLDHIGTPPGRTEPRTAILARAQQLMIDHMHEPDLSPTRVAAAIPVSERYLFAVFRSGGTTPATWLREARLERARRMLDTDPYRSVQDIGMAVGIPRASHFSRLFRERFSVSPSRYRTG